MRWKLVYGEASQLQGFGELLSSFLRTDPRELQSVLGKHPVPVWILLFGVSEVLCNPCNLVNVHASNLPTSASGRMGLEL